MTLEHCSPGDVVHAAVEIRNDGSIPDIPAEAVLAAPGTRGVIVNIGHLEEQREETVLLVRFEDANLDLGPPTGCWASELTFEPQRG